MKHKSFPVILAMLFLAALIYFTAVPISAQSGPPNGNVSVQVQYPDGQSYRMEVPAFAVDISGATPKLRLTLDSGTSFPTAGVRVGQAFIRTDETAPENLYIASAIGPAVWTKYALNALKLDPGSASRPTCALAQRGRVWSTYGATMVADKFSVCVKDGSNAYAWVDLIPVP